MKKFSKNILVSLLSLNLLICLSNPVLASFDDTTNHWANKEITKAVDMGWVNGYEDMTFKPNQSVTRGEFIKFLSRAFNYSVDINSQSMSYSDIDSTSIYYDDIVKLNSMGILNQAFKGSSLNPNQNISRLEVALLVDSALNADKIIQDIRIENRNSSNTISNILKEQSDLRKSLSFASSMLNYTDRNQIPEDIIPALINLYNSNILTGYPDKSFRPNDGITRSESIVILLRAKKIVVLDDISNNKPIANISKKENLNPVENPKKEIKKQPSKFDDYILSKVPVINGNLKLVEGKYYLYDTSEQVINRDKSFQGLVKLANKYYLIANDNSLVRDFVQIDNFKYYADGENGLIKGWKQIGKDLYYFSPLNYRMYSNGIYSTGPGVFWFGSDGKIKTGSRPGGHAGKRIKWAYPTSEDLSNKWILEADSQLRFLSQEMANWAASKEGLPFKWFGVDLNDSSGVYCCGAVYSMLKEHGFKSADPSSMNIKADGGYLMVKKQYLTAEDFGAKKIPLNYKNMWPGDISFYYTPKSSYGYNHAAIFLGYNGGKPIVVHATLADGFIVENTSIIINKWGYRPRGAVRFVSQNP